MGFRDLFFYRQECIFIVYETVFEVKTLNRPKQLSVMPKLSEQVNIERKMDCFSKYSIGFLRLKRLRIDLV